MREEVQALFEKACKEESFLDNEWRLVWNGDPWCRSSTKTIFMNDMLSLNETNQLLIHEMTHAAVGGGHNQEFWWEMEGLVYKYLRRALSPFQKKMKADYGL